jgi:uncharacterized protein YkwD
VRKPFSIKTILIMKTNLFNFSALVLMIYSLSCISCTEAASADVYVPQVMNYTYNPSELEAMALINSYRISIGLNKLEKNEHISYKCEEHNNYMIKNNVASHDDFNSRSENIIKVLGAIKVSENIAYNYKTVQGALDAWLKSPGHRETIEGDFTCFGISIRENPTNGKIYYTNIFVKI